MAIDIRFSVESFTIGDTVGFGGEATMYLARFNRQRGEVTRTARGFVFVRWPDGVIVRHRPENLYFIRKG
jgi:hypothetical protein